jgi:hypothetical protein
MIPDLVYSLNYNGKTKKSNAIAFLPNLNIVPTYLDPHWKHISWDFFKNEIAQTFDKLINDGYNINFIPMSYGHYNDNHAGIEILNRMTLGKEIKILKSNSNNIFNLLNKHKLIISQRYHGIILANILKIPSISIYHHDKLKIDNHPQINYFGANKNTLENKIDYLFKNKFEMMGIDNDIYSNLISRVNNEICSNKK